VRSFLGVAASGQRDAEGQRRTRERFGLRTCCRVAVALLLGASCSGGSHHPEQAAPGWWRDKVVYEVFVRSFADADGDGVGDLPGLTSQLDYLNDGNPSTTTDLGVDALWLMPISPSPSYHGYDVTDYRSINSQYGTLDQFDALVQAAHRRGIRVLLDMVLNHSSSQHPWFVDSQAGPAAAKRDWYKWRTAEPVPPWTRPWGGDPWYLLNGFYYYGLFSPGMPDLELGNAAVERELTDAMRFWLARGVDGFRLDAVRHYFESASGVLVDQPESHAFLRRIRSALQRDYPGLLLVGEAWTNVETVATYYGAGDELQLAFSFDLADALRASAAKGASADVVNVLARTESALAGKDRRFEAPFLSNHDQERVMRTLAGDPALARLAAAALLAMPGTPLVYYGEEIGMQGGGGSDDRNKRTPFHWSGASPGYGFTTGSPWNAITQELPGVDAASQRADPASLWNLYRRLIALRHERTALCGDGAVRPGSAGGGAGLLALLRSDGAKRVLFVANFAPVGTGPFTVDAAGAPSVLLSEGLSAPPGASSGKLSFADLGPRGFAFVQID